MLHFPDSLRVIDSHTEGEPTRVVVSGWPELRSGDMAGRREEVVQRWDHLRSAVVCEPRGHDAMVGALITAPVSAGAAAGVVFFNNVSVLNMCGHGVMGVIRTLQHLGRVQGGEVLIDTPAGPVSAWLNDDGSVTVRNVPSWVHALDVIVSVPGIGGVRGDIAWGGNWFFLAALAEPRIALENLNALTDASVAIADALREQRITGADGAEIDHIELFADAPDPEADSVNFVLCPGGAYDRSPCGTGTSAKLAVLHARRQIAAGVVWRQRSVTGGQFRAWLDYHDGALHPHIRGRAWITGESTLRFDDTDPFRAGFTSATA